MIQYIYTLLLVAILTSGCATSKKTIDADLFDEGDAVVDMSKKNQAPVASVRMKKRFHEGDKVTVYAGAEDQDSTEFIFLYDWDGNGVFDLSTKNSKVKHSWQQQGSYRVTVRAQDELGATGDASVDIKVLDHAPVAAFRLVSKPVEGMWADIDARGSKSKVDAITKYEWDFAYNGKKFRASTIQGARVQHRWLKSGTHKMALRVTDSDGSQHIVHKSIKVADQKPVAKINGPSSLKVGEQATFTGHYSRSAVDPIKVYRWDTNYRGTFRDRLGTNKSEISMKWDKPGTYQIALQVQDSDGSKAIEVRTIKVLLPVEPKAKQLPSGRKNKS